MTSIAQETASAAAAIEPAILRLMMDGRVRTRYDIAVKLSLPPDATAAALRRMRRDNLLGATSTNNITIWRVSARYRPVVVRHDH